MHNRNKNILFLKFHFSLKNKSSFLYFRLFFNRKKNKTGRGNSKKKLKKNKLKSKTEKKQYFFNVSKSCFLYFSSLK